MKQAEISCDCGVWMKLSATLNFERLVDEAEDQGWQDVRRDSMTDTQLLLVGTCQECVDLELDEE
jgi:hypothetical protein